MQQLKAEKKLLTRRKAELEKAIHYDWLDVKTSLQPKNLAADIFSSSKKDEQSTSSSFLSLLAAAAAAGMVKRLEEKLVNWLRKK